MNKKILIVIFLISSILIAAGFYFYFSNNHSSSSNYEANRTAANDSTNYNNEESNDSNYENTTNDNNTENNESINNTAEFNQEEITKGIHEAENQPLAEEQIATFSTKIYSKDSARQNNISITCNTLNDTIVKNGETFSFCGTVGQATTSKGYQKADIFDKDGNKKKGLGGGNCQISTTLYNALLSVPSLVVTERHKHSNYVPYIEKGKDAAVAYGSYDLKFRNDSGNDVKIQSSTDGENVTINLISLK